MTILIEPRSDHCVAFSVTEQYLSDLTDATLVVDANSLHADVSVGVDAHHFLTMLLLFYSDANVGIDAIGFERVYLKRGGWGGSG